MMSTEILCKECNLKLFKLSVFKQVAGIAGYYLDVFFQPRISWTVSKRLVIKERLIPTSLFDVSPSNKFPSFLCFNVGKAITPRSDRDERYKSPHCQFKRLCYIQHAICERYIHIISYTYENLDTCHKSQFFLRYENLSRLNYSLQKKIILETSISFLKTYFYIGI